MRRLALIACTIAAGVAAVVASAGADDSHSYRIEMYNAFGVLKGSEVRISGVRSGTVTDIGISEDKRAVATIETSGPLGVLGDRTRCSTEPQSLIAEYFIDCDPRGSPLPDGGLIPASRVAQTVQTDLLLDALREPYRQRLRLIVNEFGTAMAGNADNLSAAIRASVPALTDLHRVTHTLARERHALGSFNVDAEQVIGRLAERRDDVANAITTVGETASSAASRRADLSRDADLLDDFTAELRPTLAKLGEVSRDGLPLLASLREAAPSLNGLAERLPGFSDRALRAVGALGEAAPPGTAALRRGRDEIRLLRRAGAKAPTAAEILADFLRDIDDPHRAVETDQRAARTCDDPTRPCYATGREAPTGYTGLEGLLNYVYYQPLALNQFDELGHMLQFNVYDVGSGPCSDFNARPDVPAAGGGRTTDILKADPCVEWLGPNQPDVSFDLGLPRYDDSVCPYGSTDLSLCDPSVSTDAAARTRAGQRRTARLPRLSRIVADRHVADNPGGRGDGPCGRCLSRLVPGGGRLGRLLQPLGGRPAGRPKPPGPRAVHDLLDLLLGP